MGAWSLARQGGSAIWQCAAAETAGSSVLAVAGGSQSILLQHEQSKAYTERRTTQKKMQSSTSENESDCEKSVNQLSLAYLIYCTVCETCN